MSKKNSGFTLIELLLVIIIIAIIVLYTVIQLKSESEDQSVELTTIEMENWLQAFSSYYINENKWPASLTELTDANYITVDKMCSLWPGQGNAECPSHSLYELSCPQQSCNPNNKFMGIQLKVPSEEIATKIAAQLPSAKIDKTNNLVIAYTPIPALISDEIMQNTRRWGWIASAGVVYSTYESCGNDRAQLAIIDLPNCGPGYEGHYIPFLLKQRTGRQRSYGPNGGVAPPAKACSNPWESVFNLDPENKCCREYRRKLNGSDSTQWAWSYFTTAGISGGTSPTVNAFLNETLDEGQYNPSFDYFITLCLPKGTWYPNGAMGQISSGDPMQCKGSWASYGTTCGNSTFSLDYR